MLRIASTKKETHMIVMEMDTIVKESCKSGFAGRHAPL
jgi:hypothetical protein